MEVSLYNVEFEPVGRRGRCPEGNSLLECARLLKVDLVSICGGVGACRRCRVQVVSGAVSPPTAVDRDTFTEAELEQGYRLACMAFPQSDIRVLVPPESLSTPQRTQVEGLDLRVEPDPLARSFEVQLTPPSIEDPEPDDRNLWSALERDHGVAPGTIDLAVQTGPFFPASNPGLEGERRPAGIGNHCAGRSLHPVDRPCGGYRYDQDSRVSGGYEKRGYRSILGPDEPSNFLRGGCRFAHPIPPANPQETPRNCSRSLWTL